MVITGLISLLQILFLPGLILNTLIKKEAGILYKLCYVIAFSMLFNLVYTIILVVFHAYVFNVILVTVIVESLVLLILYRKYFSQPIGKLLGTLFTKYKNIVAHFFTNWSDKSTSQKVMQVVKIIAFLFALLSLAWVLYDFVTQIGSVFSKWDSVVSYNRWASEWARGMFPTRATEYPQLLPANWSLTYVFTQSPVVMFAKLVQGVFPILFVLAMIDLGLTFDSAGLLFAVPLSIVLLKKFAGVSLFEGYMDVPVTTFILLSFYMIFKDLHQNRYSQSTLWLSGIVILAAAMTKQPGTLAFGAWVLVNFFLLLSKNPGKFWDAVKKLLLPTLVILLVIASWYIFKMNRDVALGEESSIAMTNAWAANDFKTGFFDILLYRLKLLDLWILFIPTLLASVFFAKGGVKLLILCYAVPYLLVTLCYGYYEAFLRYLTPISFVFAIGVGVLFDVLILKAFDLSQKQQFLEFQANLSRWAQPILGIFRKVPRISFWVVFILGISLVVLIGMKYPDSKLIRNYEYQQMGIGNRVINDYLADFYKDKDPKDLTLTWYPFMDYLPGLEGRTVSVYGGDIQFLTDSMKREDIQYILLYNTTPSEITDYAFSLVEKDQMILITDFGLVKDGVLFEIKR